MAMRCRLVFLTLVQTEFPLTLQENLEQEYTASLRRDNEVGRFGKFDSGHILLMRLWLEPQLYLCGNQFGGTVAYGHLHDDVTFCVHNYYVHQFLVCSWSVTFQVLFW